MAYVPANLQLVEGAGPTGVPVWHLSGVDAVATVRGAGFISDAKIMGMRVGDTLIYRDTATPLTSLSSVTVVASTGATLVA
mgnify:CR=1 FL=1